MTSSSDLRIAILGCGAVAELGHLPAIARTPGCRAVLLVDTNKERREALAQKFGVERTAESWAAHAGEFDAAIVALPHALHATACIPLLRAGKPVLMEKPMAITEEECRAMIAVEAEMGGSLAVGLMRRHQWSHRLAREFIARGLLGPIRRFDFREGHIYDWPVASDFFFRKETAGGGVMMDTGAHTLDTLLWWLGPVTPTAYVDDAVNGVEADCLLTLRTPDGAEGVVELSRTRNLRNTAIIEGERGRIEVGMGDNQFKFELDDAALSLEGLVSTVPPPAEKQSYFDLVLGQMSAWTAAVRAGQPAAVNSREALASIELMSACYRIKQPWILPWSQSPAVEEIAR